MKPTATAGFSPEITFCWWASVRGSASAQAFCAGETNTARSRGQLSRKCWEGIPLDFRFTEDEQMIVDAVRELGEEELQPYACEVAEEGEFPHEAIEICREMDLFGIPVEEEWGGLGMGWLLWGTIGELLSYYCQTTGSVFGAHILG
ncbi:MAG: hypothetical protein GF393_02070, partial [Armatimonadia bacterium]|nr:hypothetical protein [Armatimonadia bacterium]